MKCSSLQQISLRLPLTLGYLNLSSCSLSEKIDITQLQTLEYLNLSDNPF